MVTSESTNRQALEQEFPRHRLINFNYTETSREDESGDVQVFHRCEQVKVRKYAARDEIIAAVINNQYTPAAELACLNNILAAPDDVLRQTEYADYQARRALAKAIADCVLRIGNIEDVKQTIRDLQLTAEFDLRKADATLKAELKTYYGVI